jgi:hypothetical protein
VFLARRDFLSVLGVGFHLRTVFLRVFGDGFFLGCFFSGATDGSAGEGGDDWKGHNPGNRLRSLKTFVAPLKFWLLFRRFMSLVDHNSGSSGLILIAMLLAAPFAFYWLQIARRKRQHLAFRLRRLAVAFALYFGVIGISLKCGLPPLQAIFFGFLSAVAGGLYFVPRPQRERRIPTSVRRAVIARDLKGQSFDPNVHHIDHIVPFSKGGDHSMENLRVLSRSRNLERGARMPKFKDLL